QKVANLLVDEVQRRQPVRICVGANGFAAGGRMANGLQARMGDAQSCIAPETATQDIQVPVGLQISGSVRFVDGEVFAPAVAEVGDSPVAPLVHAVAGEVESALESGNRGDEERRCRPLRQVQSLPELYHPAHVGGIDSSFLEGGIQ